jgi:cell division protein FtsQ
MRRVTGRRSAGSSRKRRAALAALFAVGFAVAAGGAFWAYRGATSGTLADRLLAVTAGAGLAVADIQVEGRQMTARDAVLRAIGAQRGTPLLAVNPAQVKAELEAISWVRAASVERLFPDTIYVRLAEREPFALWQYKGKLALIDRDGALITSERLDRWPALPLVVGEDAAVHAGEIVDILASEPGLMKRVNAATRIGGRRWNLRMDNGIDVQLPEKGADVAWAQLAKLDRMNSLLDRNVELVDLRLPDRLVVRTVPEPAKETPKKGKQKNT